MAKDKGGSKPSKSGGGGSSSSKEKDGDAGGKLKPATAINVRHILCEKHSRKEEALGRLRAGEAFDTVARDMSEDKARQGGSLGWKTRGSLMAEFEAVAYALQPSSCAKPVWAEVKTREGYHLVLVEGRR